MKKILLTFIALIIIILPAISAEQNTIKEVAGNGQIIIMIDGSIYEIYSYDAITSNLWLPCTDVVITDDKIINTDDGEEVEYKKKIK